MTKCGDLFRYVPQIEQVGVDKKLTKREVMLLLERDRQLEDYLSTLECGGVSVARYQAEWTATGAAPHSSIVGGLTVDVLTMAELSVGSGPGTNDRIVVSEAGTYEITAQVEWLEALDTGGRRTIQVFSSGSGDPYMGVTNSLNMPAAGTPGGGGHQAGPGLFEMAVGDYWYVRLTNNNTTDSSSLVWVEVSIKRLG